MDSAVAPEALDALLESRWSCRAFLPQPVARERIAAILRSAQRTASWNNVQPWRVVIASGAATEDLRDVLSARAKAGEVDAPHFEFPQRYEGVAQERRRDCGFRLYGAVGIERGDKAAYARQSLRNFAFFDAPHLAIVTADAAMGTYGAVDCGGYVSTFMLAARAHGVATIAQAALAMHSEAIAAHFELPLDRRVVCGISFGYPDLADPVNGYRVPRAPLEDVVDWRG